MYNSLKNSCNEDFSLWILCMDNITYNLLKKMDLPNIKLITLQEFETLELLKLKKERSLSEYSWTCASNFVWFLLQKHNQIKTIIYLDADIYFFNSPSILIEELRDKDVIITEHRYTKKYNQTVTSGKYCVQFMVFKNNLNGLKILNWWRKKCLNWCPNSINNASFNDQKYLDDWPIRFKKIHELQHLGGGVAPWNVQQYIFFNKNSVIIGKEKVSNKQFPLVFYHFHDFYLISRNKYYCCKNYALSKNIKKNIYEPYFKNLQNSILSTKIINPKFNFGFRDINLKITHRLYTYIIKNYYFKKIYKKYERKYKNKS
ncbi:MAG: glycosyl transferase [Patescibacteria group bacterium]|nr:glycosyl transferase [Patescibacteria group bacterium]